MLINYKKIGDILTDSELNAYASLLAHNKILKDSFRLKNGLIAGSYGNYEFDLSHASIVDNGILITDETLSNNITVKLSNATQYATYTMHFTVVRYGDASILDEPSDNIETFDLSLDLVDGETVNIPLTDLQEYDVILFDSNITIQHNKPEIVGAYVTDLDITVDNPVIQTGETSTIEITATDFGHLPMPNKTIQLLKNNSLLDTLVTDSQGKCSYVYTGVGDGLLRFIGKYHTISEQLELLDCLLISANNSQAVNYFKNSNLVAISFDGEYLDITTDNINNNGYYCGLYWQTSTTEINGIKLSDLLGKTIQLDLEIQSNENIWLNNIYVHSNDSFRLLTQKILDIGENSTVFDVPTDIDRLWIRLQPSNRNTAHNCKTKNWNIYPLYDDIPTNLTITADNPTIQSGETSTLTITARGENNYPVKNVPIDLYEDNVKITTLTTDNTGKITYTYTGTGKGKTEFIAKHNNIQSATYEVIDGVLFDTATSFDGNKWVDIGVTRSHSVDGTTLSQGTDEYGRYQSRYNITDNLAIEFDIYIPTIAGNEDPRLYLRGQVPQLSASYFPRDTWNKVKIEFSHLNTKIYVNGTYLYETTYLQTNAIFQFRAMNSEFTFKNFVIYPI